MAACCPQCHPCAGGGPGNAKRNLTVTFASDQRERQLANQDRGGKRQFTANGFVSQKNILKTKRAYL